MSLHRIAERVNRSTEESFDRMVREMGLSDPALDREEAVPDPDPALPPSAEQPFTVPQTPGVPPGAIASSGAGSSPKTTGPGPAVTGPAPPSSSALVQAAPDPVAPQAPAAPVPEAQRPETHVPEAPAAPLHPSRPDPAAPRPAVPTPVMAPPPPVPDQTWTRPSIGSDPDDPDPLPAVPDGIDPGAQALLLSPEERVALLGSLRIRGSVVDAGLSAADLLAGKHPRPSVASQREIDRMNRQRLGDMVIGRPANWPEFMTYPTDLELRWLRKGEVTPEKIADFEREKQRQADEMEARAREINDWIFTYGTMRLNERAQMSRARNRAQAILKRSLDARGDKARSGAPSPDQITDEELYKDRFYGIRFASLLRPDYLGQMRTAPIAAWGHDQLITMDGGRVEARDDELVVRVASLDAARVLVLEARARGWETLRVSGDNEFCAAVKRAAKEVGMGAIIHRRGPLGIGPFSRPEVIMPALPGTAPHPARSTEPQPADLTGAEQKARQEAAPQEDRAAADLLLSERTRPAPGPGADRISVRDPLHVPPHAGPSGLEPA